MVNISKKKVKKEIFDKISNRFIKYVIDLNGVKKTEQFFSELLSEKERIMLIKRFAIILLLDRGYSFSVIKKSLKVSSSTVTKLQKKRKAGDFKSFTSYVYRGKNSPQGSKNNAFVAYLEKILEDGLLPMYGGDRYRSFPRNSKKLEFKLKAGIKISRKKKS